MASGVSPCKLRSGKPTDHVRNIASHGDTSLFFCTTVPGQTEFLQCYTASSIRNNGNAQLPLLTA